MATTAAIALNDNAVTSGQMVTAALTVSNGGSADVLVMGIQPKVTPNGLTSQAVAVALGAAPWGAGFPQTVPASGSELFYFSLVPNAPTTNAGWATPGSYVYSVGATLQMSDGSLVEATPATVTVTNPPVV